VVPVQSQDSFKRSCAVSRWDLEWTLPPLIDGSVVDVEPVWWLSHISFGPLFVYSGCFRVFALGSLHK
jgi:hypothetical protein